MKRLILAALLGLASLVANAANTQYYICNCDTSADSRCAAGNSGASNSNTGLAPVFTSGTTGPWATSTKIKSFFSSLAKGDTVSFCQGGAWDLTDAMSSSTDLMNNLNSTANNAAYPGVVAAADYITINAYRPSWMPAGESNTATSVGASTLVRTGAGWTVNQWANYLLVLWDPQYNVPQYLEIASNTSDTLTLRSLTWSRFWWDTPSGTTAYTIQPPMPRLNLTRAGSTGIGFQLGNSGAPTLGQGFKISGLHFQGVFDGAAVSSISFDGTNALVTTSTPHNMATGQDIIVTGVSVSAANKQTTATNTGANTFTYPCTTASGCTGSPTGGSYRSYGATAISIANGKRWVTLDGIRIDGFKAGITCDGGYNTTPVTSGEGLTRYVTLRNSQLTNISDAGYGGGCYQTLIENNRFDTISYNVGQHFIYTYDPNWPISYSPVTPPAQDGIIIRSNVLKNNSVMAPGTCPSVGIVLHGAKDDYQLINNKGQEDTVPTLSQCWFFAGDEGYYRDGTASLERQEAEVLNRPIIRGNQAINYAQSFSIDVAKNALVENNYVYTEVVAATGFALRSKYFEPTEGVDQIPQALTVRNNSAYFKNPGASTVGFRFAENENGNYKMLGGNVFVDNLAYFATGGTSEATAATACFDTVSSAAGWPWNMSATVASPTKFTFYAHGMSLGQTFYFTGTMMTGLTANTMYWVSTIVDSDNFRFSASSSLTPEVNVTGGSFSTLRLLTNGVTVTPSSPTISYVKHGLVANQQITFNSSTSLPTGITSTSTVYFVRATNLTADTFEFSATKGGAAVTPSSAGVGMVSVIRSTSPTLFTAWDNNLCFYAGTTGKWVNPTGTLSAWQTYSGLDTNSLTSDPAFAATPSGANGYSLAIGSGSPAKNAGHATRSSTFGIFGCRRASADATPDIGAFEYGCSADKVPASPVGGSIQ